MINSSARITYKCDTNIRADVKNEEDCFGGRRRRRLNWSFWRTIVGQYEATSGQQGKSSTFSNRIFVFFKSISWAFSAELSIIFSLIKIRISRIVVFFHLTKVRKNQFFWALKTGRNHWIHRAKTGNVSRQIRNFCKTGRNEAAWKTGARGRKETRYCRKMPRRGRGELIFLTCAGMVDI